MREGPGHEAFTCPGCRRKASEVLDSRGSRNMVRRRRVCKNSKCRKRFTTYEITDEVYQRTMVRDRAFRKWMVDLVKLVKMVGLEKS
jgi:transcriptional regulator NrdR family protein